MNIIRKTLIIILIVFCLSLCGCAEPLQAHTPSGKDLGRDRFHIIEGSYDNQAILVDIETGVEYLWVHPGVYSGGITVLVDYNGQPLIAPGFKDYQ